MNKTIWAIMLIILLLLAGSAGAQIYKYIDQNGQQRWTDDLSQIPEAQRASAQRIAGVNEKPADAKAKRESSPVRQSQNQAVDKPDQTAAPTRKALEKEKADLDAQYQQLLQERKELEQMKAKALNRAERSALKARITNYNKKTVQYQTQLNAFNKKIKAYNQKIMAKQPSPQRSGQTNTPKKGTTP